MTEKEIFEVIKYFKEIYTTINFTDTIYFVDMNFYYIGDLHYILHGELFKENENAFTNWVKEGGKFFLRMDHVSRVKECLKKNILSLDITKDTFSLKYKNKDGNEEEFLCKKIDGGDSFFEKIIEKTTKIRSLLIYKGDLPFNYFDDKEILELYLKDNKIVEERTTDKLIEIPVKRIISILKSNVHSIRFSDCLDSGKRYTEITGNNKYVRLRQIFATI